MDPVTLTDAATGSMARIAAHLGFNCYDFQAQIDGRTIHVLDSDPNFPGGTSSPSGSGIPILFPYPNRIRGGRFEWNGKQYEISLDMARCDALGNAIHGFCLDRPWRVIDSGEQFVTGRFQLSVDAPDRLPFWPADFVIDIRYELRGPALRADVRITNPDQSALPFGFGTHPYFRLPLAAESDPRHCLIEASAGEEWELIDCLPTGVRKPVGNEKDLREGAYFDRLKLDDVLTGLQSTGDVLESLIIDESAGLQISQVAPSVFRELVVFTPPNRNAVCLEPYTCVTDAINLQAQGIDAGWRVLEPGEEFHTWIEIRAGLVLA